MPLRAAMPRTVRNPTSDAERDDAVAEVCRQNPADQGQGQCQEDQRGQAPVPEGGLQQQEDADRGDRPRSRADAAGSLPLSVLAQELGVVLEREVDRLQTALDIARDRAEVAAADVGVMSMRREAPSRSIALGVGLTATSATSPRRT